MRLKVKSVEGEVNGVKVMLDGRLRWHVTIIIIYLVVSGIHLPCQ